MEVHSLIMSKDVCQWHVNVRWSMTLHDALWQIGSDTIDQFSAMSYVLITYWVFGHYFACHLRLYCFKHDCCLFDSIQISNYRGITLCPIVSKLFEYCILHSYESYMYSIELQFGFKRNMGCSYAVFALRHVLSILSLVAVLFSWPL